MSSRFRVAVMICAAWCLPMCVTANAQKPVRVVDITYLRPSTLDDLWQDADLVARVRVVETAMKAKEPAPGIKTPLVHTEAKVDVLQHYRRKRTDTAVGTSLVIAQRAGRLELADEIIEIAHIEPIVAGREYVLFLQWHPMLGTYEVTAGPEAIFELRDGRVRPFGKSAIAKDRSGIRDEEFLSDLRFRSRFEPD